MDLINHLPGFAAAYGILLISASSPGPAVAMLLGIAMTQGRGAALAATFGIATGSVAINVLTLVGVGLLLRDLAWAMEALRLIGAGYLLYLAYGAFRKAAHPPAIHGGTVPRQSAGRLFVAGALMQVTNPKAIAFWLAIASIGATRGGGAGVVAAFLAGGFLISFSCHAAWSLMLSASPFRRAYGHARRWIEGALGCFFTLAAVKLASSKG